MKKFDFIAFALALVAGLFLSFCLFSCSTVPAIPSDEVETRHYQFPVAISVSDAAGEFSAEATAYLDNVCYPDSAWVFTITSLYCSSPSDPAGKIIIPNDGYFQFSTVVESFGGYVDSLVGSGFFDSDTVYFSYSYQELSGNGGVVSGHSF